MKEKRAMKYIKLGSLIACTALATLACKGESGAPQMQQRVVAVQDKGATVHGPETFCEAYTPPKKAAAFRYPELLGSTPKASAGTWRWVNVWATWCKPCIEEIPTLLKWKKELGKEGVNFDLQFLSVDEKAEDLTRFRALHPSLPPTLQIADRSELGAWLERIGLGQSASIPIQIFVDAQQKLRCVRGGAVNKDDLPSIKALLSHP